MKMGSGALLVALGLVILWVAVTGRLSNLDAAWRVLNGGKTAGDGDAMPADPAAQWANVLPLPLPQSLPTV